METSARSALAGARSIAPLALGAVPFALLAGIAAVETGFSPLGAAAVSVVMYAGAAQLVAMELLQEGAPWALVVLTVALVNLRFSLYSASLAVLLRGAPRRARALVAYLLTDQSYAVSTTTGAQQRDVRERVAHYLGAGLFFWTVWQAGTLAGALLGARLPAWLSLEFAVPLSFIALLLPALRTRPAVVAALVAGVVAALAASAPHHLGLPLAALSGVAAGALLLPREA